MSSAMNRAILTTTVAAALLAFCAEAPARTTCEVKDGNIVVTMYIAFRGGDDELIARWVKEITDVWNGQDGYQEYGQCKCRVKFVVEMQKLKEGERAPRGWHYVEVKPYDGKRESLPQTPDGQVTIAYMGRTTSSPSVRGASIDGVWSTRSSAPVNPRKPQGERFKDAAHEAGHVMGLPDYYNRKTKWMAKNIMGHTSGPNSIVTPDLIRLIVQSVTGKGYCPKCPPPSQQPPLKAVKVDRLKAGLDYEYYEGPFEAMPDFTKLKCVKTGQVENFDLGMAGRKEYFGVVFTGYIRVPADGLYSFIARSDDGSQVMIGGRLVTDNDGCHGMTGRSGEIKLQAGLHPIRVMYFQAEAGMGLEVRYAGPNIGKGLIPPSILFTKPQPPTRNQLTTMPARPS